MIQIINPSQSNIFNSPMIAPRPARVGDRLRLYEVRVSWFRGCTCETLIFIDLNTGDEVEMSVTDLTRAQGTVRLLLKNFDTVEEVLKVAYNAKVIFNISKIEMSTKQFPTGEQVRVSTLTIDCEN